ncbi:MAG TPA: tRNA (adenosine(37)-N6)-dimethylallyltransferase MiaA [Gammaproteobacteria bacterium]
MGATATGKTDLAVRLCDRYPFEIISVDSALIYRGMDIGTAKPSKSLLTRYPHRLIDILDPAETYSAARFRTDALKAMRDISRRGRIPLLVGGTMLYFRALQYGLSRLPEADPHIRAALLERVKREGLDSLHMELRRLDPPAAQRIHPHDPQRILRALEVHRLTGKPISAFFQETDSSLPDFRLLKLALWVDDRNELHSRIARRFEQMVAGGFVEEVAQLKARGDLTSGYSSMRTVGYRQVWQYLDGEFNLETMCERGVIATRQLAKRQITWLRGESDLFKIDFLNPDLGALSNIIEQFINM